MKKQKTKWIIEGTYKSEEIEDTFFGTESQVQAEVSRLMLLPCVEITGYRKFPRSAGGDNPFMRSPQ